MAGAQSPSLGHGHAREARSWSAAYAALVAVVLCCAAGGLGGPVYDDAYFFKRFAAHAAEGAGYSWNAADGPVHGCTSQLYMLWARVVVAVSPTHWVLVMRVANAALLCLGAHLIFAWLRALKRPSAAFACVLLVFASPPVLLSMHTGMESAMCIALLSFALTRIFAPDLPVRGSALRGLWICAVYLARPDAALVVGLALMGRAANDRAWSLLARQLGVAAVAMGLTWLVLWFVYGSALPLSFFMKTLALDGYDAQVVALGRGVKRAHVGLALLAGLPALFWLARAELSGDASTQRPSSRVLALAALAAFAYHALLTNEIMGYRARFYLPGLIALAMAGAVSARAEGEGRPPWVSLGAMTLCAALVGWAVQQAWLPQGKGDSWQRMGAASYFGALLAICVHQFCGPRWRAQALAALCMVLGVLISWPPTMPSVRSDASIVHAQVAKHSSVRGLETLARCMPADITVFHSEMGMPGMLMPRARLVDLAGILSPEFSLRRSSFQAVCEAMAPEAIFLPHKNYAALNKEIRSSPCFANYVRVVKRSSAPLHIRADREQAFSACAGRRAR